MSDLSHLPSEVAKPLAMPGAPRVAPRGLNRDGLGNSPVVGKAWADVLKLLPVTVKRLGIEDEVRDGSFAKRWLGSGAFGTAFTLPDPMKVLKMTTDPEDLTVLKMIAEAGRPLDGLIRVYEVFRMELPFAVGQTDRKALQEHAVKTVYGIVTEPVVTFTDYAQSKGIDRMVALATPHYGDEVAADQALRQAYTAGETVIDTIWGSFGLRGVPSHIWEEVRDMNEYGAEIFEGHKWCEAHGITYGADAHHGNFALAWRDGKFVAVKSDMGFRSVKQGLAYAQQEAKKAPLAANRRRYEY